MADDPWAEFSPSAAAAPADDPWAEFKPTTTTADVAKSFGIGIPKGVAAIAGLPGDIAGLAAQGLGWATGTEPESWRDPEARRLPTSQAVRGAAEQYTGPWYEPQTKAGQYAQTVGEFLPAALTGPGGIARRAVMGAVVPGLASEAAGQLTQGTAAEPYARVAGALTPSALAALPAAAQRALVSPRGGATRAAEVANLEREGVRALTAGQRTGSRPLQYLESSLGDVTGAGARMVERGQEQFTAAALRRAGIDADRATPEVIDKAFTDIGNKFDDLAARNVLQGDTKLGTDLGQVIKDYTDIVQPANQAPAITKYFSEVIDGLTNNNGTLPGKVYQNLRSRIETTARNAGNEQSGLVADTLRDMKNALDAGMERSMAKARSPDLGMWQQARRQYRNMLPIERAVTAAGEGAATGLISPSALRNAVINQQGRRAYARGTGDFAPLVRSGEAVMKPLPQSGTAPRHYMSTVLPASLGMMGTGLVTGNLPLLASGAAGALGPPLAGRTLMSRPVQRYLGRPAPWPRVPYLPAATAPFSERGR